MKKVLLTLINLLLLAAITNVLAQMPAAISLDPANPTAEETFTITFDPAAACFESGTLVGGTSVAMHSGVELADGTQWNHVIEFDNTGANGLAPNFTDNGDGTFSFTYNPLEFYGFPSGTVVTKICAVFNNGTDWTTDGRDYDASGSACQDFFIPLAYSSTEPVVMFNVNLNKQILDGNFDPAIGNVYAMVDGMSELLLENTYDTAFVPQNIYVGEISTGLTEGQVLDFKFKMDQTEETINRSITLVPGSNVVDVWFNDEPLIPPTVLTLNCDMNYQIAAGNFDAALDSLDVAGSFNGWGAMDYLSDDDGDGIYSIDITPIDPGAIEFKFRINGDWNTSEFAGGGANRELFVPATDYTFNGIYDNFMPNAVPVTFICHMPYQTMLGVFNPETDYLDVAGSFNGWGGGNQLGDVDADTVYKVILPVDTSSSTAIEFKFRINGDWGTSEFPGGGPNRMYTVLDTVGGFENIIDVWYSNDNPTIATAPRAVGVEITPTNLEIGTELMAMYMYEDINGDLEGATTFEWAIADDDAGTNKVVQSDGTTDTYTLVEADANKYVFLSIRPVALTETGEEPAGTMYGDTVTVFVGPVWPLDVANINSETIMTYPNPVNNTLFINHLQVGNQVVLCNILGQPILSRTASSNKISIATQNLPAGLYFINVSNNKGIISSQRIVKN